MGMSASQTVPQQQSSPYFGMQTQPAQPLNQIGDMSFAQPAGTPMQPRMSRDDFQRDYYARGNMTVGAPSFADQQINAAYDQYTGQAQPAQQQPRAMSIDEFARSPLMGATTMEFRNPVEYQGSMRDPELVRRYEQYTSGQIQQPMQQESSQDLLSRMNQARQAGFQFGPTPNQPYQRQMPYQMPYQQQMRYQMPYQMPYRQPMYQMPYQMPMSRQRMPLNMFGGLGSLFGFMRR